MPGVSVHRRGGVRSHPDGPALYVPERGRYYVSANTCLRCEREPSTASARAGSPGSNREKVTPASSSPVRRTGTLGRSFDIGAVRAVKGRRCIAGTAPKPTRESHPHSINPLVVGCALGCFMSAPVATSGPINFSRPRQPPHPNVDEAFPSAVCGRDAAGLSALEFPRSPSA
jgi:hypothetical protein